MLKYDLITGKKKEKSHLYWFHNPPAHFPTTKLNETQATFIELKSET
jgi:hypothetical protein